jgi:hypothetical protein
MILFPHHFRFYINYNIRAIFLLSTYYLADGAGIKINQLINLYGTNRGGKTSRFSLPQVVLEETCPESDDFQPSDVPRVDVVITVSYFDQCGLRDHVVKLSSL